MALARMNRPQARFFRRLRIERPPNAYAVCCLVSALCGSIAFAAGMVFSRWPTPHSNLGEFLAFGLFWTIPATIGTAIIAAPVVLATTWAGIRWKLENAAYYFGLGIVAAASLAGLTFNVTDPAPFLFERIMPMAFPIYGGTWGAAWWYLYRRWKSEPA